MRNFRTRALTVAAVFATASAALVGCGEDTAQDETDQEPAAADSGEAGQNPEVEEDLANARQVILDGLDEFGDQSEFLLADDVSTPEQKYGMWVLPYEHSEATESMTSQVNIDGGTFTIEAVAAEDGTTYMIDQDGNVSQAED